MPDEAFLLEQREERDGWIKTVKYSSAMSFYLGYQAGYKRKLIEADRSVRQKRLDRILPKVCTPVCAVQPKLAKVQKSPVDLQSNSRAEYETIDEEVASLLKYRGLERFYHLPLSEKIIIVAGITALLLMLILSIIQLWPAFISFLKSVQVISCAYADSTTSTNAPSPIAFDVRSVVGGMLTAVLALVFVWCVKVELSGSNAKAVTAAKDYNKIILGFIIATAKSSLGA